MRRIVLFIAVLFMTVPAMGVSTVDINCVSDSNEVTVSYESSENRIRAFGLTITVDGANITKVVPGDVNYRIYPGQIVIEAGEVTDYNTPYDPCDLGDANVAIEMGSLYTTDTNYMGDPNAGYNMQPGLSGTLLKFYVDNHCTYDVSENPATGGIVMENPDEEPVVDSPLCSGSVTVLCTVPDVVGDANAIAQAAIITAGLQVGNITTDCNDTIADGNVISTNPAGGVELACESNVDIVVSTGPCPEDCYLGQPDEAEWIEVGRPECWCYPRQCHGDADGKKTGNVVTGYVYVGQPDQDIMSAGWLVKDPPKGPGILGLEVNGVPVACADFAHDRTGNVVTGYVRVGQTDQDKMSLYWLVKEPPKGTGTPPNCEPGNREPE